LSRLLGRPPLPLNPAHGIEGPRLVAQVDEARCIGCTKCLPPCPVDAIVGASRQMHTVVAALCTGCELCVAPCPVDCIVMIEAAAVPLAAREPAPSREENRARYEAHLARAARRSRARSELLAARKARAHRGGPAP